MRTCRLLPLALLAVSFALAGCQKDDKVENYVVEHPEREKVRMLTAILPDAGKTWVFKLFGPDAAVSAQKQAFDDFIASIRLDDQKKPPIRWAAPAGWKEEKGGGEFRVATFRIDAGPRPMEMAVTLLPALGKEKNTLLDNVNRWRGQVNQPPIEAPELDQLLRREKVDGHEVILADLDGRSVYRVPARGHGGGTPPMAQPKGGKGALPFAFEVPDGWAVKRPLPAFAVAAYEVTDGQRSAIVSLSAVGGGEIANIVRWRGMVGLPAANEADVRKEMRPLEVAGRSAKYVDLANPRSPQPNKRILGVIVPAGGATWYVKMVGPAALVGQQKANFETFVRSFKLEHPQE